MTDLFGPSGTGVIEGDCISSLQQVPNSSVHLILSDIPYGIGVEDWDILHANTNSALSGSSPAQKNAGRVFRRRGKPINGWSNADADIPREYGAWCASWAGEWLRVLKPGGSAIVLAGRRMSSRCIVAMEDAGFNFRDLLAWIKPQAAHRAQRLSIVFERRGDTDNALMWAGWRLGNLRPIFEPIIWCFKPYRVTIADNAIEHGVGAYNQDAFSQYFGTFDNVFTCGMDAKESGRHIAQKPLKLMKALIEMTTLEGQIVLDPFAGSGTTVLAAKDLGRGYLAIEQDSEHVRVIRERLGYV